MVLFDTDEDVYVL